MKTCGQMRQLFLEYFKNRDHEIVASSSLIPSNDPTLLFTNAGMVQFKDVFLGHEQRKNHRAVSSQRCVRAGGKHNDLENVGYNARHHTFFEMLGNFSFGDYFKTEAIKYAWEYLTEELDIAPEKLWVTVFEKDDESASIWLDDIGISAERFSRCDEKNNFWSIGDTGLCGPCSEIFYDHGADVPGGPPGSPDQEGDRYIEIWNLVFTQYNRDKTGKLNPIPRPSVDTGMGLERITAIMQNVHDNYEIDLFQTLIADIKSLADGPNADRVSTRVIADHLRSCVFLISDGVTPANEGRGYVLRRIIRRAIRHGYKIGLTEPFFYKLVPSLQRQMSDAYPELNTNRAHIEKTLLKEEERFAETLDKGLKRMEEIIAGTAGRVIAGDDVFRLYDTYGFPADLTADIARERNLQIDAAGFDAAMEKQRRRTRAASKFEAEVSIKNNDAVSTFSGYSRLKQETTVIDLYRNGQSVKSLRQGAAGEVILLETPFYAEAGGQVGDTGKLCAEDSLFEVENTKKQGQSHIHTGVLRAGSLNVGDTIEAQVDGGRRTDIVRNHSATHLLHAALRKILGDHVTQRGSLVAPDRLRFDFSHDEPLSEKQLNEIQKLVNRQILENKDTQIQMISFDQAKQSGAMSLFGEKYDDIVRVLSIGGEFSRELCGGTHVNRAGDIGLFKIISETGVAAGIRRIEAVTGEGALHWIEADDRKLIRIAELLKTDKESVDSKLRQQTRKLHELEKEVLQLRGKLASSASSDMAAAAVDVGGIKVLTSTLGGADPKTLRDTVDQLKNKLGSAALVLASVSSANKINLVAGVTKDSTDRIKASDLVNFVAEKVGGKGGGRADMAQAGGDNPAALDAALAGVPDWVRKRL